VTPIDSIGTAANMAIQKLLSLQFLFAGGSIPIVAFKRIKSKTILIGFRQ
jgi:uncharacterized protein YggU (UPF0235/DUF167 family)